AVGIGGELVADRDGEAAAAPERVPPDGADETLLLLAHRGELLERGHDGGRHRHAPAAELGEEAGGEGGERGPAAGEAGGGVGAPDAHGRLGGVEAAHGVARRGDGSPRGELSGGADGLRPAEEEIAADGEGDLRPLEIAAYLEDLAEEPRGASEALERRADG